MTIASRRLARRCRERFADDTIALSTTAEPTQAEPPTTVEQVDVAAAVPRENVDAAK